MAAETTVLDSLDVRLAKIEGALPYLATKEDISDLRGEMLRALQSENAALRSDLQGEIGALRSELVGKFSAQGNDLQGQISAQGSDLRSEIGALRGEMSEMRDEIGKINGKISEISGEIKTLRWSMTLSVSLIGVGLGVLMLVLR